MHCSSDGSNRFSRSLSSILIVVVLMVVMLGLIVLTATKESHATPAWARKYNADCAMCHFPVIPRLNNFGQMYRRMGYRTESEINKNQDLTNVSNMLSGRLKTQFSYENIKGQVERTQFTFPDASLFYAGAISRNFSGFMHVFANNSTSLDVHGHIMGNFGTPENMFMFRIGQMHMLEQEGVGGFDRPTSININPVHTLALTRSNATTGGSSYNFDQRQKGIELAYIHGPGKFSVQISNGLNQNGSGTQNSGDIDSPKDYMVFYEHLLDDLASGFTLFYYNGTTHGTVTPTGTTGAPTSVSNEYNFNRFGLNLSKVFPVADLGFFELQGGYVRSHDNNPAQSTTTSTPVIVFNVVPTSITTNAFYVESQQYLTGHEFTFYERYSRIDLNGPQKNGMRIDYTAGFVKPLQSWLRFSSDYTYTYNPFGGTGHTVLAELQANW